MIDFMRRRLRNARLDLDSSKATAEEIEALPTEATLGEANIICSDTEVLDGAHIPVIDIDVPVHYEPSSTPGHGHLYINQIMTAEQMWKLLDVMAEVGLVEGGYVEASKKRGYTAVRLPWIRKGK